MSKRQKKQAQPEENGSTTPPPAYFLSVTVENVRCFGPAQTLDLSDGNGRPAQWTVILGDNGTGKTTMLQAIAALELVLYSNKEGKKLITSRWSVDPSLAFWKPYRSKSKKLSLDCSIFEGSSLKDQAQGWVEQGFGFKAFRSGNQWGGRVIQHRLFDSWLNCCAYGASRHMAEAGLQEDQNADPTASLFSDKIELPNAEEWLLQADYAARRATKTEKKRVEQRRDQIIELLIGLLPDVEALRYAEPEDDRTSGKIPVPHVEFQTPYGWVRIDQLSLGYRTMIAWTVDLARRLFERYPDSPNPLAEPAVVLVDEIDLHLHPKWQRDIIRFLSERFPNTQFIVTAHSPLIVQAALDANLVVLRRDGDHVVIDQDFEVIPNLRVDQILTSEFYGLQSARPRHLDELLEKRRVLLSKGTFTEEDRKKLKEIEAKIGPLPAGDSLREAKAIEMILSAAEQLEQKSDGD